LRGAANIGPLGKRFSQLAAGSGVIRDRRHQRLDPRPVGGIIADLIIEHAAGEFGCNEQVMFAVVSLARYEENVTIGGRDQ
jgi:hypothetical protein